MTPVFHIAALYKFFTLDDPEALKSILLPEAERLGIKGSLLLAHEGINGTIAAHKAALEDFLAFLRAQADLADLKDKRSHAEKEPFRRLKIRLKREIVTMGAPVDPKAGVGKYVPAKDWNSLIESPDVVLIDTRNDYEIEIGSFKGAVDPKTRRFREFPAWVASEEGQTMLRSKPRVAMFCTGGIRCEKSTAYLKQQGFEEVYHLDGGILKYLETVKAEESLWQGDCFVFDERVSVGHGLEVGDYGLCRACRRPLAPEDRESAQYERGVSCPACYHETTDGQKKGYRHRQMQMDQAKP